MSESKTDKSTKEAELEPGLMDIIYDKLKLPEAEGIQMANSLLLREIVLTLKQIGVLSAEHVENLLGRVEHRIAEINEEARGRITSQLETQSTIEFATDILQRRTGGATTVLQRLRERLAETPPEGK